MVIALMEGEKIVRGPFSGNPEGIMPMRRDRRRAYYGVLPPEGTRAVVRLLAEYKVLSSNQLMLLGGFKGFGFKQRLSEMVARGYIDRLVTEQTPPLYVLGEAGCRQAGVDDREWDILSALKIAAANQFCIQLKNKAADFEYMVEPHLGLTAKILYRQQEFGVLAPRWWPGQNSWALEMLALTPLESKTIIIAGIRAQAEELARLIRERQVRFTWDAELKEGITLYKKVGQTLIPEKIFG